jgi:hypothetical protein
MELIREDFEKNKDNYLRNFDNSDDFAEIMGESIIDCEDKPLLKALYRELFDNELDKRKALKRPMITPPGFHSNNIITQRNGGVKHQFLDSIGGDSSNYR